MTCERQDTHNASEYQAVRVANDVYNEVKFKAEFVEAITEEFTSDFVVHGIYFGYGNPEQDGEHWNFTRTLGTDDTGVCTVKEIQQVTVYGGISKFYLERSRLVCEFDEHHSRRTGIGKLDITYEISEEEWSKLATTAALVFSGEDYFRIRY